VRKEKAQKINKGW